MIQFDTYFAKRLVKNHQLVKHALEIALVNLYEIAKQKRGSNLPNHIQNCAEKKKGGEIKVNQKRNASVSRNHRQEKTELVDIFGQVQVNTCPACVMSVIWVLLFFSQVIYDHEIVASAEEVIVGIASQRLIFLASAWDDGRNDSGGKTGCWFRATKYWR